MSTAHAPSASAGTAPAAAGGTPAPGAGTAGSQADNSAPASGEAAKADAAPPKTEPAKADAAPPKSEPAKADAAPPKTEPAKADSADSAATLAALQARIDALEAQATAAAGQAQLAAKRSYLTGIISEEILALTPKVEIARDGNLTDASKRQLDQWRAERPHYFGRAADADGRSTPTTADQFSAAEIARLKEQGVDTTNQRRIKNLAILTGGIRSQR